MKRNSSNIESLKLWNFESLKPRNKTLTTKTKNQQCKKQKHTKPRNQDTKTQINLFYFQFRESPYSSTYRLPPLHQPPSWGTRGNLADTSGRILRPTNFRSGSMLKHLFPTNPFTAAIEENTTIATSTVFQCACSDFQDVRIIRYVDVCSRRSQLLEIGNWQWTILLVWEYCVWWEAW